MKPIKVVEYTQYTYDVSVFRIIDIASVLYDVICQQLARILLASRRYVDSGSRSMQFVTLRENRAVCYLLFQMDNVPWLAIVIWVM